MSLLDALATGGISSIVEGVTKAIDNFHTCDEERFKAELETKKLEVDLEKAYLADVGNARHMQEVALQQDDRFSKRFIYYFAILWSLAAMVYFACVTFLSIPETVVRMADTILGALVGIVISGFFNFFYGSSARSAKKDEVIREMSSKVKQ
jgi:hypothetical protein